LLYQLLKKNIYQPVKGWCAFFIRVFLASASMSMALYYFVDANDWNQWHSGDRVINLLKWILIGLLIYSVTLVITGLKIRHLSAAPDMDGNTVNR
jgi:putative peptidoglycan lipid II flippase